MGSGGTDDVGAEWNTARDADEVTLLSEEITAARVTALRHAVAEAVRAAGLTGHGLEDFVLAVHELVINVVRHGGGSGEVRLSRHHDLLTCQVSDDGPGLRETAVALPSPGEVGHRGLWLAQQLTEGLTIDTSDQGTNASVTARLSARPTVNEGR
ncbi:ATP-binding protein [Micromonospora echinofusca]|uniref:ATP-binding protein n=1 Tax=Micromonospora echinofusca TaxID=47858 RepID=A0ABS3VQT7_MICEH|nr:ATP-binding protein [Micromonospora echinofusca]MBO4206885.1 ATP-binding protein [Micromonospora echinofusca]